MSNDVQKLKQTISILKKENSEFQRYNKHLQSAITQVSESNEKLLYSLHEKYNYFGNLECQSKSIESDIQNKLWNIENFDFNNGNFIKKSHQNKLIDSSLHLKQIHQLNTGIINQEISNTHHIINEDDKSVGNNIADQMDSNSLQIDTKNDSLNQAISKNDNTGKQDIQQNSVNFMNDHNIKNSVTNSYMHDHNSGKNSFKSKNKEISANYSSLDNSAKSYHESNSSKSIESNSRYSQKSIKSLVLQNFSADGIDSIEKLKQKQNFLYETNQKLKAEIKLLLSQIGDTNLFIKFQKESESYLKALRELNNIENSINQSSSSKDAKENQENNSNHQTQISDSIDDHQNHVSSVFLTDVESIAKSEPNSDHHNENSHFDKKLDKVEKSCQTNDNIRARFIVKYFSKGTHLNYIEKQNNKIAYRRASIVGLASEIEKCKVAQDEIITKKTEITSVLTQLQNISVVDIYDQRSYEDKETETDQHIDFDYIISQIEENKKYTKGYLMISNEKFNLQTIYDQKVIEFKLAQSSSDHKTANYRSLLRNLKTTDPDSYAKFIGTVGMSSKDEQKRQRCLHQINKFTEKIKKANVETKEIETKEKQVKLRIEMLERELAVFKNPKDHMKSALADLCQKIALDQEKIRDQMREMALVKLESDFVDRIKTRIFKKTSKINELNQKINEMAIKLKKIKGRCRYSLRSGQNYPITSPSELDSLQETFDKIENEVNSLDQKIDTSSKKSISYYQQLSVYKLSAPPILKSCQTFQHNLKNVL